MQRHAGTGRAAQIAIVIVAIACAVGLAGGLNRLHAVRVEHTDAREASAELAVVTSALSAVGFEALAGGPVDVPVRDRAAMLRAAGDRHLAAVVSTHTGHVAEHHSLQAAWQDFSRSLETLLALAEGGLGDGAGIVHASRVTPAYERLSRELTALRADTAAMGDQADQMQLQGSLALALIAMAGLGASGLLEGRRRRMRVVTDVLQRSERTLEHQATHDGLTGLANRARFLRSAGDALAAHHHTGVPAAVLLIDLDRFKDINDTFGHHIGDHLLCDVATRFNAVVGPDDLVARLGGDEFAVLLPGSDSGRAQSVAAAILAALVEPVEVDGAQLLVEASIGIAVHPVDADGLDQLLRRADAAMYDAKQRRRGYAVVDPTVDAVAGGRLALLADLRRALAADDGQLHVVYQPQSDPRTGSIGAVEALLRWDHPTEGAIPPGEFIPLVEQTGLIEDLTRFVVRSAVGQLAAWDRLDCRLSVAVNVSARNLLREGFVADLAAVLSDHGIGPDRLELELTETSAMLDPTRVGLVLADLTAMGVRVALDDFGTGFSSLSFLRELPLDTIKVDRRFVADLGDHDRHRAIIASIVDLAGHLGLRVVAEGVETADELAAVTELGCDRVQGYLLGRPLDPSAIPAVVRSVHQVRP